MRFFAPLIAAFAAVAVAQTGSSQQNAIVIPNGGLSISTGENTIKWTNPSSGTVTIKLQQGSDVTPSSGYVLASGVSASAQMATFDIPASVVNSHQYSFEIIDDSDPSNYNFSTNFAIQGATGTMTGFGSSGSASSTTMATSASTGSSSMSVTGMSSSSTSDSSSSSSSGSTSSMSGSSSTTAGSNSASSSMESAPTSTGAASFLSVNGGLAALGAVAVLVL